MLNGLDLFSGIGGLSLALSEWVRPISYCEIDGYYQGVLLNQMAKGSLSRAPIWDDIRSLDGYENFSNCVDIIYGGFPCQDISIAGHGKGLAGERSGLFFEIVRLAKEIKPKFIFLENSDVIPTRGGKQIIESLTNIGFDCRWIVKSAREEGSPQMRKRWFCLAYSNSKSSIETNKIAQSIQSKETTWIRSSGQNRRNLSDSYWKTNKSPLLGVDDGISFRVDRARCLGNSVCIEQAREAFKELIGLE